jgi:hypothetical protein
MHIITESMKTSPKIYSQETGGLHEVFSSHTHTHTHKTHVHTWYLSPLWAPPGLPQPPPLPAPPCPSCPSWLVSRGASCGPYPGRQRLSVMVVGVQCSLKRADCSCTGFPRCSCLPRVHTMHHRPFASTLPNLTLRKLFDKITARRRQNTVQERRRQRAVSRDKTAEIRR